MPLRKSSARTIGRYRILERVGEGGCGVVYVAEHTEPVRRRVALKVIKLGIDTKQWLTTTKEKRRLEQKWGCECGQEIGHLKIWT